MNKKVMVKLENFSKQYNEEKIVINGINLDVYDGEFLTFLGPSGCGKTTILRSIAGFDEVTAGKVYLDGKDVTYLEPQKRALNVIFQNYALFSHMTIEDNIGFSLKIQGLDKKTIHERVVKMLNLIQLKGYEKRKPSELSGGEQQRVAIARALINKPKLLLLDEPLSALDLKLRKQMQVELKALQEKMGITFIYVTHNQEEALTMSDRIAVINKGKIEQLGTPTDIYEHPKTKFVADFIGDSNIFDGIVKKINKKTALVYLSNEKYSFIVSNHNLKVGQKISILIRPENIIISDQKDDKLLKAKVIVNTYDGSITKVQAETAGGKILKIALDSGSTIYPEGSYIYLRALENNLVVIGDNNEKE